MSLYHTVMPPRAWLYFCTVALLWGVPYFLIKIALGDLSPAMVVFARVAIGAVTLLPVAAVSGTIPDFRGRMGWILLLAALEIAIPFTLIATGEQWISSSLTGILIATEPLFVAAIAFRVDISERVSGQQLFGMVVGLAGVVMLLGLSTGGRNALLGAIMILLATLSYAGGALLIKVKLCDVSPIGVVAATLVASSVVLSVPALFSLPTSMPSTGTIVAMLVLGTACTGIAFLAFFRLIAIAGAGRATLITYVAPAIAVLAGVAARGETFSAATAGGLALILAGSWLGTMKRRDSRAGETRNEDSAVTEWTR